MSEEQYKKKKQMLLLSLFCTIAVIVIVGISYAFWQKTKTQEDTNVIASKCFDIELTGKNAINLAESYPLSNEEGMQTLPFTFTVKNICDYKSAYTVNLESLVATTFQNSSVKVALDDNYKLYSDYKTTNTYFDDSKESRILASGVLSKEQSKTYNLRLWIDENAPITEQNKVFESRIVINAELENEKSSENKLEIGDYISMTPTSTSYAIATETTGYESEQIINPSELSLWRVIGKNDDGTVDVVSEYVSSIKVYFSGQTGYMNLVGGLNEVAAQYTNEKYVQSTRHMGYSSQIETCTTLEECLDDDDYEKDEELVTTALGTFVGRNTSKTKTEYWLTSRYIGGGSINSYHGSYVNTSGSVGASIFCTDNDSLYSPGFAIRPILTLKADIEVASGDGKSADTAYQLK